MYTSAAEDELHFQRFLSANCFGDYLTRGTSRNWLITGVSSGFGRELLAHLSEQLGRER